MLSKNSLTKMIALCAFVVPFSSVMATESKEPEYNDHPKYNFHGEVDNTDIFAIQLDRSEEEQDDELESLEEGYPPVKPKAGK